MSYREQGATVLQVLRARHSAGDTRHFDDQVAWLVTHAAKSTVAELIRVAWRAVGAMIERVVDEGRANHDPFVGLRSIGIDEISYKKGHRYLTVCVDHDSGLLVWAAVGKGCTVRHGFITLPGEPGCHNIRRFRPMCDLLIGAAMTERCANATVCVAKLERSAEVVRTSAPTS